MNIISKMASLEVVLEDISKSLPKGIKILELPGFPGQIIFPTSGWSGFLGLDSVVILQNGNGDRSSPIIFSPHIITVENFRKLVLDAAHQLKEKINER